MTRDLLIKAHRLPQSDGEQIFPIRTFMTTGDKLTTQRLTEAGGKGLFTKEIDAAILHGEARISVHSMKDVPIAPPEGLEFVAYLEREDPRDVLLISAGSAQLDDLPQGATLGTASLRRQAQALHARPDLKIVTLRGNVGTRLDRLNRGEIDATFLARAGLNRLGRKEAQFRPIEPAAMLPAAGQGVVGIAIRSDDAAAHDIVAPLNHEPSWTALAAERAALSRLDGSCRTPIAIHAALTGDELYLRAEALTPDGVHCWRDEGRCAANLLDAQNLGRELGENIKRAGGDTLAQAIAAS